ncbi:MAG: CDP-alcohol phosphatidyltransferase family protein [Actinobacteria bacterium]|nr:CDP-alcohol phosphatidyltransferase family protein [Actinomycetota bacterium]
MAPDEPTPEDRAPRPDERGAARIRDMPAPRRSVSVIAPLLRAVFAWPFRFALAGLYRAGVRPWHLTVASLVTNVVVAWLILEGLGILPGFLLLLGGLFDVFDGSVARLRGEESRFGAFLDSMLDRVSDAVVFGALYWELREVGLELEASLALSSLVISLVVSHLRAEAEALGTSLSEGVFQRLERVVALAIALTTPGAMLPALAVLTALGGITVLQRSWSAIRRLSRPQPG